MPPIQTDPSSNLTVPAADPQPSISPPLITGEETPAIQEKKEEFTRRLLSKSLHREPTVLSTDKVMDSPTVVHKTAIIKPVIAPRLQKPIVDNRRVNSVERHPPPAVIRNKLPTTATNTSVNTNHQRLGKFSLDIFQPHPKSNPTTTNMTNKKSITIINKTKCSTKMNTSKTKTNPSVTPDEEIVQPNK